MERRLLKDLLKVCALVQPAHRERLATSEVGRRAWPRASWRAKEHGSAPCSTAAAPGTRSTGLLTRNAPMAQLGVRMNRFHIVGHKNHGKTSLIVQLVHLLAQRGLRVGTVKHTHHRHELDVPGKDSYRHRKAGAVVSGIVSRDCSAIFLPHRTLEETGGDGKYNRLELLYGDCDLVLVEGDLKTTVPKIEVWRAALGSEPLARDDLTIDAIVSDDPLALSHIAVFPRSDLGPLVAWLLDRLNGTTAANAAPVAAGSDDSTWRPDTVRLWPGGGGRGGGARCAPGEIP